jgi:hypothetical protein
MSDALPLLHIQTPTHGIAWIERYLQEELALRNANTVEAYQRVLQDFAAWLAPPNPVAVDSFCHRP